MEEGKVAGEGREGGGGMGVVLLISKCGGGGGGGTDVVLLLSKCDGGVGGGTDVVTDLIYEVVSELLADEVGLPA